MFFWKRNQTHPLYITIFVAYCSDSAFVLTIIFFLQFQHDTNTEVVLHPDYVIYQDKYYTGPKITFSQCHIQINDSTAREKQGAFNIEWVVDDLVDIKSQLFRSVSFKVLLELLLAIFIFCV